MQIKIVSLVTFFPDMHTTMGIQIPYARYLILQNTRLSAYLLIKFKCQGRGFRSRFKYRPTWQPKNYWPFKCWTSLVLRSPLYSGDPWDRQLFRLQCSLFCISFFIYRILEGTTFLRGDRTLTSGSPISVWPSMKKVACRPTGTFSRPSPVWKKTD